MSNQATPYNNEHALAKTFQETTANNESLQDNTEPTIQARNFTDNDLTQTIEKCQQPIPITVDNVAGKKRNQSIQPCQAQISLESDNDNGCKRVCCLHDGRETKSHVVLFTEITLQKCIEILNIRKTEQLKYSQVLLPKKPDLTNGYHPQCYKIFTALSKHQRGKLCSEKRNRGNRKENSKQCLDELNKDETTTIITRSSVTSPKSSVNSGIFPNVCIFCNQSRKRVKGVEQRLVQVETREFEDSVRKYVQWMEDSALETRISGVDFVAKEVKYHGHCRVKYQTEAEASFARQKKAAGEEATKEGMWHINRLAHQHAFEALSFFLTEYIFEKKEVMLLSEINEHYQYLLGEYGGEDFEIPKSSSQKLEVKIIKHYGDAVKVLGGNTKRGNLVFASSLSIDEAVERLAECQSHIKSSIRNTALLLRQEIMKTKYQPLPEDITVNDIEKGEVEVPELLLLFFQYLIGGPDYRRWESDSKQIRTKAIAQDTIFAATSGLKKSRKHLMLGMALKSLTNSRTVLEFLNKYGHVSAYHTISEIETELTFNANKDKAFTPFGMKLAGELGTGVAWDNFDLFVETADGKNTLHDTVGIAYQVLKRSDDTIVDAINEAIDLEIQTNNEVDNETSVDVTHCGKKRRRAYDSRDTIIQPYRKKPRIKSTAFLSSDNRHRSYYDNYSVHQIWKKDVMWMAEYVFNPEKQTPLWSGWNAKLLPAANYTHKVWYLPQINQSPTNNSVVVETLRRSIEIAKECQRQNIAVTYDLAIAKEAIRIQEEESPKFDAAFIALGSFHIEMAFFKALGKIIAESGGPYVLQEAEALAKGSLNSFLSGKNYKRCKRLHEMLALSFEILHFRHFVTSQEDCQEIERIFNIASQTPLDFTMKEWDDIINRYIEFSNCTKVGGHGKTAQFWLQYVNLIHTFHEFTRSVRTGNFELYVATIPKMTNLFFALNHPNYARWLVKYYDNLVKLQVTHPQLYNDFQNGWFSLKRTSKSFSSIPIDLTLEQTINADAASQRTGIMAVTNSISARQKWADSHFLRMSIVSHLKEELGLNKSDEISRYLRPKNITRDNTLISKIVSAIEETMNPFTNDIDSENLFNLATGKAVSKKSEDFLLKVIDIGESERNKFIEECRKSPDRFEKEIKKQPLCTFATCPGRKKLKTADGKVVAACLIRDLFGSLLYLSLEKQVDISYVLQYPLTPFPLSTSHIDGSLMKTPKSNLMKYLEGKIVSTEPGQIDVTIIDAMFFLHAQQNLPSTFLGIAKCILAKIMAHDGHTIHFVSDKWVTPSIKDIERESRSSTSINFSIKGPAQQRPGNWHQALKNPSFKDALIKFLTSSWSGSEFASIIGDKILYANFQNTCFIYRREDDIVVCEEIQQLYSSHEEADSRMFYHLSCCQAPCKVVIRTIDTDCLIIAIGIRHLYPADMEIWMDVGLQSRNNQRYIQVNTLHSKLGESLSKALLFYHAISGCDYTASFVRKGKVKPLQVLEKDIEVQNVFIEITSNNAITNDKVAIIEKYICQVYGQKKLKSVNDARTSIFMQKYCPKSPENKLNDAKKLDSSLMPPCSKVLLQKIKRAQLVARKWYSSYLPHPPNDLPEDFGWNLVDGKYEINWYEGEASPTILELTTESSDEPYEECDSADDEEYELESDDDLTDDETED